MRKHKHQTLYRLIKGRRNYFISIWKRKVLTCFKKYYVRRECLLAIFTLPSLWTCSNSGTLLLPPVYLFFPGIWKLSEEWTGLIDQSLITLERSQTLLLCLHSSSSCSPWFQVSRLLFLLFLSYLVSDLPVNSLNFQHLFTIFPLA